MPRQYEFTPPEDDPRKWANNQWDTLRDELNIARDQLEASNAECISQAALIDMLRKELADSKSNHDRDQVALTIMRTKLKAAGMLVLDALKDAPEEEPKPQRRLQDLPPARKLQDIPKQEAPKPTPLPEIEEENEDESAKEIVRSIHALAHKWP